MHCSDLSDSALQFELGCVEHSVGQSPFADSYGNRQRVPDSKARAPARSCRSKALCMQQSARDAPGCAVGADGAPAMIPGDTVYEKFDKNTRTALGL